MRPLGLALAFGIVALMASVAAAEPTGQGLEAEAAASLAARRFAQAGRQYEELFAQSGRPEHLLAAAQAFAAIRTPEAKARALAIADRYRALPGSDPAAIDRALSGVGPAESPTHTQAAPVPTPAATRGQAAPPPGYVPQPWAGAPPAPRRYGYPYRNAPRPAAWGSTWEHSDGYYILQMGRAKRWSQIAQQNGDIVGAFQWEAEVRRLQDEHKFFRSERSEPHSVPMMVGGLVLAGLSAPALGLGLIFSFEPSMKSWIFFGAGFAAIGAGIPLAIIGSRRVKDDPSTAKASPVLLLSPQGAGLRITF